MISSKFNTYLFILDTRRNVSLTALLNNVTITYFVHTSNYLCVDIPLGNRCLFHSSESEIIDCLL